MIWVSLKLCIKLFLLPLSLLKGNILSKTYPSFLTLKEGFFLPLRLSCKESSTFSPSPSSSGSGDVTALLGARNRYALRLADHQRSTPDCAGWDRLNHCKIQKSSYIFNQLYKTFCLKKLQLILSSRYSRYSLIL